jgi:quercetin dioxygenase-like cupin family protein
MEPQETRIYGIFNLPTEIDRFPPDPETEARHRAVTLVKTDTIRVVLVTMVSDGYMHEHDAPGPVTLQVLSGTMSLSVDGGEKRLSGGDLLSVAPGVRLEITCEDDGAFLLTIAHLSRTPDRGGRDADEP